MISAKGIYKNFGKVEVLKGVSLDVEKGERVAIVGPSGSGKSTFLRCLNLLEQPTFGEVWFDGKLLTPIDPYLHFDIIEMSNTFRRLAEERKLDLSDEKAKTELRNQKERSSARKARGQGLRRRYEGYV